MIKGRLWEHKNPLPAEDESPLLNDQGLKLYQTLIGMDQWACTIGCLDISFAMSSLSRFSAAPHAGHLQLAIYMFGYLKKHPNHNLVIDSGLLIVPEEFKSSTFRLDFLEDYPNAQEELDPTMPEDFGSELETSIFCDADHAHDQKFQGSSSLSAAPQFCGQAEAKLHRHFHLLCRVHRDAPGSRGGYITPLHAPLSWHSRYKPHKSVWGQFRVDPKCIHSRFGVEKEACRYLLPFCSRVHCS